MECPDCLCGFGLLPPQFPPQPPSLLPGEPPPPDPTDPQPLEEAEALTDAEADADADADADDLAGEEDFPGTFLLPPPPPFLPLD